MVCAQHSTEFAIAPGASATATWPACRIGRCSQIEHDAIVTVAKVARCTDSACNIDRGANTISATSKSMVASVADAVAIVAAAIARVDARDNVRARARCRIVERQPGAKRIVNARCCGYRGSGTQRILRKECWKLFSRLVHCICQRWVCRKRS